MSLIWRAYWQYSHPNSIVRESIGFSNLSGSIPNWLRDKPLFYDRASLFFTAFTTACRRAMSRAENPALPSCDWFDAIGGGVTGVHWRILIDTRWGGGDPPSNLSRYVLWGILVGQSHTVVWHPLWSDVRVTDSYETLQSAYLSRIFVVWTCVVICVYTADKWNLHSASGLTK